MTKTSLLFIRLLTLFWPIIPIYFSSIVHYTKLYLFLLSQKLMKWSASAKEPSGDWTAFRGKLAKFHVYHAIHWLLLFCTWMQSTKFIKIALNCIALLCNEQSCNYVHCPTALHCIARYCSTKKLFALGFTLLFCTIAYIMKKEAALRDTFTLTDPLITSVWWI